MITQYTITGNAWTQITTAGQSGTCWLDEDGDGAKGTTEVRVWHGETAPDASKFTEGRRVYKPQGNSDVVIMDADSGVDIYYARCAAGAEATLTVDVS